ncbi:MAG: hypothetical protein QF415_03315 [Candidatus Undinarchaeales archaeon]|jgi:hypothetical protein|nr:hypothetical protein [Candidatus Undinarchaeales archaeon]MDP7491748.1 hypothetical protein [Candidatus Undinarchaeales archaeon]
MGFIETIRPLLVQLENKIYPLFFLLSILLISLSGIAYLPVLELRLRIFVDSLLFFISLFIIWGMGEILLIVIREFEM